MYYDVPRGKWLSESSCQIAFGYSGNNYGPAYFPWHNGVSFGAAYGFTAAADGTVVGMVYTRTDSDEVWFVVRTNGVNIGAITSTVNNAVHSDLDWDFEAGNIIAIANENLPVSTPAGYFKIRFRE